VVVRVGSSVFRNHAGEIMGCCSLCTDRHGHEGRSRSRSALRPAFASMGTLSAGMAHESRIPWFTIKTFTQLLPERYEDAEFRGHLPLAGGAD